MRQQMNDVVWLSTDKDVPADSYWDQTLLKELLKDLKSHYKVGELKEAIVIIPGAYLGKDIDKINKEINKLDFCKVITTSDEENNFPIDELQHDNFEIFGTYLNNKYKSKIKWLPIGPASINHYVSKVQKVYDWFFAGQINHESRKVLASRLKFINNGRLVETAGFAQGLDRQEYYAEISKAKVVPAPKGNISPDSFRLYEALEVGAVPIAENKEFWKSLFHSYPFPVLSNSWKGLQSEIMRISNDIQYRNEVFSWWQQEKLRIKDLIIGDDTNPTVIIPASPIFSHPSTKIIDETIESIRTQLPKSRIVVTFDGIRKEQSDKRQDYNEFISGFLSKYNNSNIYPMLFNEHTHQVGMAKAALENIKSDKIIYVEQDTPFTDDFIDWDLCSKTLSSGELDLIRFHFEASIPEPHRHMMLDSDNANFIRTCQWSQRPHIATTAFYRRILDGCFSKDAKSFIEDKMHGVCHNAYVENGLKGWYGYRLGIYNKGDNLKRSYHTDGRAGQEKFDDSQVF